MPVFLAMTLICRCRDRGASPANGLNARLTRLPDMLILLVRFSDLPGSWNYFRIGRQAEAIRTEHMGEMATSLNMDLSNAMAWLATTAMRLHGL
jgi:hypothetical protein